MSNNADDRTPDDAPDREDPPALVDDVVDDESDEDLGEIAGGGEITDLAGDSPSS